MPPVIVPPPQRGKWFFRGGLKNWRVRSRLLLLITIPTLAALVLGGISIYSSVRSALLFQRVSERATLASDITLLATRLADERDQAVYYIALGSHGGRNAAMTKGSPGSAKEAAAQQLQVVDRQIQGTNNAETQVRNLVTQIKGSYSASAQQEASAAISALNTLPDLRNAALKTQLPVLVVVQKYRDVINDLVVLENETAQGVSDATLNQTVRVLGLVSLMKEEASEQRAILTAGLIQHQLAPGEVTALTGAQSLQQSNLQAFQGSATPQQRQLWDSSVARSFVYLASSEESQALSLQATQGGSLHGDSTTADDWYGAMSNAINFQLGGVERNLVDTSLSRSTALRSSAVRDAAIVGGGVLLFLVLALLFTAGVARSMVRPLRRLRAGALQVAGVRLPDTVRRMSETDAAEGPPEVQPIDVNSSDEIGEVARAFDQVHREAIRLAANEAALRGNVNAMFVNLSRRSQSLVERQIRLIDDLEQGEQDSERLGNLFQLDHLATRMRRNSENLLVLAGHEVSRRRTEQVALVDVLRAAVSEIEQYERVTLNVQPGISARGQAVNDVVHLVAELAENATSFSAADTPVNVSGHLLSSGGVLLDITDQGVGMGSEEMAHANWRLDNPPVVDVAVSRRMGLFVVARLAARHGIRVRLRPASLGGLTALVWLPDEVVSLDSVTPGSATGTPGLRRFEPEAAPEGEGPLQRGWLPDSAASAADDRSATERAVNAARAPRFSPLRGDSDTTAFPMPSLADDRLQLDTGQDGTGEPAADGGQAGPAAPAAPAEEDRSAAENGAGPAGQAITPPDLTAPAGHALSPPDLSSPPRETTGPLPSLRDLAGMTGLGGLARRIKPSDGGADQGADNDQAMPGVVLPAGGSGEENRLPIFESVESDWFRRGRRGADRSAPAETATTSTASTASAASTASTASTESTEGWSSPSDAGWRAAEAVAAPAAGGVTQAGLPKRVPKANLVPGGVTGEPAPQIPVRSAALTRDRFASFQRGIREARAAVGEGGTDDEEDSEG
ncbi:MAG TPA: nitrate- and nitrite sensing domain-containing protein [Streptosporangiaceae bacterium]|nr:nitrate- and nitrite sensing domain-containing protein [Streptosporangiaceae bacterium]